MDSHDKLRIVVVGDSGVGKTCLVHILCHNEALRNHTWTIGCSVEVKKHIHTRTMKSYFVEFIDVGGSTKHPSSRNMFYQHIDGIILVHDVSNRKSYYNLWRWIAEVLNSDAFKEGGERAMNGSMTSMSSSASGSGFLANSNLKEYDFELQIGDRNLHVPILVVGTKADLVKQELTGRQRRYSIVEEYGGDCFNVCTLASTHFARGSIAAEKIDAFFDKVIDKKFHHLQSPTFAFTTNSTSGNNTRDDYRRRTLNMLTTGVAASSPSSSSNNNNNVTLSGLGSPGLSSSLGGGYLSKSSATANSGSELEIVVVIISSHLDNLYHHQQLQQQQELQQKSRAISPRPPSSSRVFIPNNVMSRTPTRTTTNANVTTTHPSSSMNFGGSGMSGR
ncbi:4129_t:CDS:2 [Ambispora gerdemannii]|uniref:4129_t:CDS:1 n=1 Tax=Ambispora gerdemannii TaxID=144530 RepID=A0A9N9FBQ8_9GLOM|nr:4129_t:CDS:2 [Ambispora gerdemannii]